MRLRREHGNEAFWEAIESVPRKVGIWDIEPPQAERRSGRGRQEIDDHIYLSFMAALVMRGMTEHAAAQATVTNPEIVRLSGKRRRQSDLAEASRLYIKFRRNRFKYLSDERKRQELWKGVVAQFTVSTSQVAQIANSAMRPSIIETVAALDASLSVTKKFADFAQLNLMRAFAEVHKPLGALEYPEGTTCAYIASATCEPQASPSPESTSLPSKNEASSPSTST